jgi:TolA-binding protein
VKRELKRQIKQDELLSGYEHAVQWLLARRDEARITGLVVIVLGLGFLGLRYYLGHRNQQAERAMTEAMALYRAPTAADIPEGGTPPTGPVHATSAERYQKSAAAFEGVASRYGSTSAGRRARYFEALCRIELGDHAAADKALQDIAARKDRSAVEPTLARLALAESYRRQAKLDAALEEYKRIVDDPASVLPRDHSLMRLGATFEEARRPTEAGAAYRRLADEFPESVYAQEARRRAEYLEGSRRS